MTVGIYTAIGAVMDGINNGLQNSTGEGSGPTNATWVMFELCTRQHDVYALVRFICDVIFNVPISVVGLVGNSLAFLVLLQHEPRLGTTLLLQTLAIADNIVLLERFFIYTLPTIDSCRGGLASYNTLYGHVFRWLYPTVFFVRMLEVWLVVFVTIERWLCVTYPHRAKELCSRRRVATGIVTLMAVSFLINLPRFFEFYVTHGGSKYAPHKHVFSRAYTFAYRIGAFFLFNYLLPIIILAVLNVHLYRALKRHELWLSGVRKIRLANMASRALTTIVVAIVTLFIVCNLLPMVSHLIWSLEQCFQMSPEVSNTRKLLSMVSNVFVTLNCSVNFIIYAVGNSNFRRTLLRLCRVNRKSIVGLSSSRGGGGGGRPKSAVTCHKVSTPSTTQNLVLMMRQVKATPNSEGCDERLLLTSGTNTPAKASPLL